MTDTSTAKLAIVSPVEEAESYYDILGVPATATLEEIKAAYFRLVRVYRPQMFPERFQQFNEASRTLTDERRRKEYDQLRKAGRRVQVLVDQGAACADKDPQKAITLLKSAIALAPDAPRPRAMLAHVLMKINEFEVAERLYRWLLEQNPRDETLHCKLGKCLWAQKKINEAERELFEAVRINPLYHDAVSTLGQIYEATGMTDYAVQALEQAIANDGVENYHDFDSLMGLLLLHLSRNDHQQVERSARRLLAVLPPGDPAKCAKAIRRLYGRAHEFFESGAYAPAAELLRHAGRAPLEDNDLKNQIAQLAQNIALTVEARRLNGDDMVTTGLRQCMNLRFLDRAPAEQKASKRDSVLARLQSDLAEDARAVGISIEYLRREYPGIAAAEAEFLAQLQIRVARRLEMQGGDKQGRNNGATAQHGETVANGASRSPASSSMPNNNSMPAPAFDGPAPAPSPAPKKGGLLGWLRRD